MHSSKRPRRDSTPWPGVLLGIVIGLLLSVIINVDIGANQASDERLLQVMSHALANRQQPIVAINSDSQIDPSPGWHQIDVYIGADNKHLPFYSAIPNDYFDRVQWFSQRRQDFVVSQLLRNKKNGYFVDLAANDAVRISNTYALETHFDWQGLCIEPNPEYWAGLAYRKCQVAAAVVGRTTNEELHFRYTAKGPRGGIVGDNFENRQASVANKKSKAKDVDLPRYGVKLEEILERFNTPFVIDYFSLDIEGAESFVMESFPFQKYRFNVLTVERNDDRLSSLLERNGYKLLKVLLFRKEFLWIHKDVESELDMSALDIDTEHYHYRERIDKISVESE
jgi:hypothetical protein